ncbi:MAG: 50S ribosomal protein L11 methyltransferase [Thermodesulfobacteriota bacterium]
MSRIPVFEYHTNVLSIKVELPNGEIRLIEINPGWAFGTGSHVTTKLCIKALEEISKERKLEKVLDVGCGSGVLGICAVALGASMALAMDIDATSAGEARINVEKNGFSSNIEVLCGSLELSNDDFDVVIANILTDSIVLLSEELKAKLKPDGALLLSGIHEARKEKVIQRFRELGLFLDRELSEEGWVCLLFKTH